MFWVDQTTQDILEKSEQPLYLITDSFTPSGHGHVGNLRGVVIHELVKQGLNQRTAKATFQFGLDDFDPMDGLPGYVSKDFQQYMGLPLCNVPAPDGKSTSFAEQYSNEFLAVLKELGIEPKIVKTSELYSNGSFNKAIEIILDNAQKIREINQNISGSVKGEDWYPLNVLCPKCGKIGTTRVHAWNGQKVRFTCEENMVEWARGCGYEGEISPFDGNAKLPWKVEWPSKWYLYKSDIEGEGKDHAAASGSREVADAIYRQIFKAVPPYDIPYEYILIGGAKMSSSKGLGATAKEISDMLPPNLLRFLFVRTRPKRAMEFNPQGDTIPLLYDEYDRTLDLYHKDPQSDLARAFYYAQIDPKSTLPKYVLRFSKLAFILQMPHIDILDYAEKEKGGKLTFEENLELEQRASTAKHWLEKFAPENYHIKISEQMPDVKLSENQQEFIKALEKTFARQSSWTGEELHHAIHEIKNDLQIPPKEAFSAIYKIFLNNESGPQAGWLLAFLKYDFVLSRLKQASRS